MARAESARAIIAIPVMLIGLVRSATAQNCGSWSLVANDGPSPRVAHGMAFDDARGVAVVFGGQLPGHCQYDGQTWEWNGLTWAQAASGPPARDWLTMTYDRARGVTVLFGGRNGCNPADVLHGDTWEWNGHEWTLRSTSGPSPRMLHDMVYDDARDVCVLFGGWDGSRLLNDTWEWDGFSWSLRATSGPRPRYWHAMAFDEGRERTVLFGGSVTASGAAVLMNDTWEWDGAVWAKIDAQGPAARGSQAMAYDPSSDRVLMFGGDALGPGFFGEVWDWNGLAWTRRSTSGIVGRSGPKAVSAPASDSVLLFGGFFEDIGQTNELWHWAATPGVSAFVASPIDRPFVIGDAQIIGVNIVGASPFLFRWHKDGVPLSEGPTGHGSVLSGSETSTLTLTNVQMADSGGYDVRVTDSAGCVISSASCWLACPGDLDRSRDISLGDLAILLAAFGQSGNTSYFDGDLDEDEEVDLADLAFLLSHFGQECR